MEIVPGNPSVGGLNARGVAEYSDFGHIRVVRSTVDKIICGGNTANLCAIDLSKASACIYNILGFSIIIIIITKHGDLRLAPTSPVQTKMQLKFKK